MTAPPGSPPPPSFLRRLLSRALRTLLAWLYAGAVLGALPLVLLAVKAKRWNTDRKLRRLLRELQAGRLIEGI